MNNGGDAAEQIVRLSLEGFEVAVRLTGSAAKNIAILLASVLKQEISQSNKTRGKARLTNMIKSGEIIVEEAMGKPIQKEGNSHQNPSVAKTDKSPLSERDSETTGTHTDKGVAKAADKKPSVREKLDRYKAAAKAEKEAERTVPEASKEKPKTPEANRQTVHRQPKKSKKPKER